MSKQFPTFRRHHATPHRTSPQEGGKLSEAWACDTDFDGLMGIGQEYTLSSNMDWRKVFKADGVTQDPNTKQLRVPLSALSDDIAAECRERGYADSSNMVSAAIGANDLENPTLIQLYIGPKEMVDEVQSIAVQAKTAPTIAL